MHDDGVTYFFPYYFSFLFIREVGWGDGGEEGCGVSLYNMAKKMYLTCSFNSIFLYLK